MCHFFICVLKSSFWGPFSKSLIFPLSYVKYTNQHIPWCHFNDLFSFLEVIFFNFVSSFFIIICSLFVIPYIFFLIYIFWVFQIVNKVNSYYTQLCFPRKAYQFSSFSCSVMSDSLQHHELQHTRPPCPSPTPGVHPNPCPLSQWCHPIISSSVIPFSSCSHSFPTSGSFPMSQLFTSDGQSIGVSASTSVLPMNTQDWFPLGCTGLISLQSKGLSRVFSNTTVQKHQFFCTQLPL